MDNLSLLEDGLVIMTIGMGVVFLFLIITIYAMTLMSYVIKKINIIFPEKVAEEVGFSKSKASPEGEVALAIALSYARAQLK